MILHPVAKRNESQSFLSSPGEGEGKGEEEDNNAKEMDIWGFCLIKLYLRLPKARSVIKTGGRLDKSCRWVSRML